MNTTTTGIVVALAVVVVAAFFIFPNYSPFNLLQSQTQQPAAATAPTITPTQATTTMPDATQLQITDQTVGTGAVAQAGDSITVNYVGSLTNGTVFDASANHGQPFTFTLGAGQVIPGWDQGLVGMKVGGKRTLVIPPALGYGAQGAGGVIPPNATLVFQVELVSVSPAK